MFAPLFFNFIPKALEFKAFDFWLLAFTVAAALFSVSFILYLKSIDQTIIDELNRRVGR
jgi:hypothetical protein